MKTNAGNLRNFALDALLATFMFIPAISYLIFCIGFGLLGLAVTFGLVGASRLYGLAFNFKTTPKTKSAY